MRCVFVVKDTSQWGMLSRSGRFLPGAIDPRSLSAASASLLYTFAGEEVPHVLRSLPCRAGTCLLYDPNREKPAAEGMGKTADKEDAGGAKVLPCSLLRKRHRIL